MKLPSSRRSPPGWNCSRRWHASPGSEETLSEILGVPADEHGKLVEDMHNHEAKSAELHFALLTNMRTSFVNPLPREDMYALSRYLNEAMEKLDAAAELVALYKLERLPKRAADQLEIISRQAETHGGCHAAAEQPGRPRGLLDRDPAAGQARRTHAPGLGGGHARRK